MDVKIETLEIKHVSDCSKILCAVYNNELWQCRWTEETATAYLLDFVKSEKFVGYVLEAEGEVVGALFAKQKVWWNNSELFIEEMFVLPKHQRKGYGSMLLKTAEKYVKEHKLAGITLATNKYAPAPMFYQKNGFQPNEAVLYMYKIVE